MITVLSTTQKGRELLELLPVTKVKNFTTCMEVTLRKK